MELIGASQNKLINEIEMGNNENKILQTIERSYKKAPFFNEVFFLLEKIILNQEKNIAKFIGFSLQEILNYLEIDTNLIYSSRIKKNTNLKGQEKILDICKTLNASNYINAIGGQELYSKEKFNEYNINLKFLKTNIIQYKQFNSEFVPFLSIIDILM